MSIHSSEAETSELPTREDVQELRQAIESLRDHVQIVWQAVDEVREVIEQVVGRDAAEFWHVEPPQDFPLGRYRPFAGFDPAEEWNEENGVAVEPPSALQTSVADLPAELADEIRSSVVDRWRESQSQEGMDSHAEPQRQNTHDQNGSPPVFGPTQQRSLWNDGNEQDYGQAAIIEAPAAEAAADTSQKEAEPVAAWFVRPDRQNDFGGLPQYEWPAAEEDRDSICVDRIYADPADGVTHRFTIRRGDTVEVFFAKDRLETGTVVGISEANQEVRVQFDCRGECVWFYKGSIYPAAEPEPAPPADDVPMSTAIATSVSEPADGWQPADAVTHNVEAANNGTKSDYCAPLAGHELTSLMHKKVTISELAKRTGITQKRIRQARDDGLSDPHIVRDWLQAILGHDPGPIEKRPRSEPYSLDDWIAFRHAFSDGRVDAAGIRKEFCRMKAGKQHFIDELVKSKSADQLKLMAMQFGAYDARQNTKQQNAESIFRSRLTAFTLGDSVRYSPMQGETYQDAVERIVMALTDESIAEQREKNQQERAARDKALTTPESFQEYSQFVSRKGTDQLSDEQLATWDRLNADISRGARKHKKRETVEQFQSAEIANVEFRIIEGFHDREQVPLWIVQLTSRVERETFNELKIKASQLGGWWSSFKKNAAGFQFRSQESAEKFASLTDSDADRSDELLARKLRKMDNASERLHAVAASLEERSAAVLAADDDKLKNTARRADMAASMRAQAYSDQADAKTLRSIAAALAAGGATYLDGIWNAAQVRTLETILRQARRERINRRLKEEGSDRRTHS